MSLRVKIARTINTFNQLIRRDQSSFYEIKTCIPDKEDSRFVTQCVSILLGMNEEGYFNKQEVSNRIRSNS